MGRPGQALMWCNDQESYDYACERIAAAYTKAAEADGAGEFPIYLLFIRHDTRWAEQLVFSNWDGKQDLAEFFKSDLRKDIERLRGCNQKTVKTEK